MIPAQLDIVRAERIEHTAVRTALIIMLHFLFFSGVSIQVPALQGCTTQSLLVSRITVLLRRRGRRQPYASRRTICSIYRSQLCRERTSIRTVLLRHRLALAEACVLTRHEPDLPRRAQECPAFA